MSQYHSGSPAAARQADAVFQQQVRSFYRRHGRHDLPWRQAKADGGSLDPYQILVSEIMLQQTQVHRVIPKFESFLARFPDTEALASASLGDVLRAWNGLGYNRRAKFLHEAARQLVHTYDGIFPTDVSELVKLPGVGPNTAGAIQVYAFNRPALFIETNIRTVYIHHFFAGQTAVADRAILSILARTVPKSNPRIWYWALMDYGTYLKQSVGNLSQASQHYTKQSKFTGSNRQIRGSVIRLLGAQSYSLPELESAIDDERLPAILSELQNEGLIRVADGRISL